IFKIKNTKIIQSGIIKKIMNETKCKSGLIKKEKSQKRSIVCVKEENYLQDLMLNSKSMQRMQDFISNLE
ncbi:MAG: hypothetical protein P4K92_05785, partial [Candidatus Nitrosotalea sp.]|nr:hypothetical protein [Candidatus Nitrosotalea sp.]